jgi:acetylornithine deacetylase/succinyl-diaminopimelate desuccinylase-like protein
MMGAMSAACSLRRLLPFALVLLALAPPADAQQGQEPPAEPPDPLADVRHWRQRSMPQVLRDYVGLLSIPNVAGDPEGLRRTASWIRAALEARGVQAKLLEQEGAPPAVLGVLEVAGAERTLGLYAHYDGQPVRPEEWTFPPFEPRLTTAALSAGGESRALPAEGEAVEDEWRLYARSASDDKAPIQALLSALDALSEARIAPTSSFVFLFEGEEESGSAHLGAYLDLVRAEHDLDGWLVCDGPVHPSGRPQVVFGVRGIATLELTAYGPLRPLHSGHYGNWAPNPSEKLVGLLASMKSDDGRVRIEGFYDSVEPLGQAERAALEALPDVDEALRAELGLAATDGGGAALAERLLLPSLNLRGLWGGGVGEQAANVIPTEAVASIDLRLVRGNDPEAMLDRVEAHVRGRGWHVVTDEPDLETRLAHPRVVRLVRKSGYRAARTPLDDPLGQAVVAAASRATDEEIVRLPSLGGSLPLYLFQQPADLPVIVVPIVNHDNNQHGADENLRLGNLAYGIDLMAELLTLP